MRNSIDNAYGILLVYESIYMYFFSSTIPIFSHNCCYPCAEKHRHPYFIGSHCFKGFQQCSPCARQSFQLLVSILCSFIPMFTLSVYYVSNDLNPAFDLPSPSLTFPTQSSFNNFRVPVKYISCKKSY